ncbi:hypothetical protein RS694_11220 [Rhodoferax saidenbachensis]|uniref:Uncharacterized protein n=1 Tax=Rhodoferax saidenbachensis TaxID=1484693 RepID=A0A1P8KFJ4_9BURK|nr:hypothetical protein RS694_11220 [Rhodoferax saidenbachensis]
MRTTGIAALLLFIGLAVYLLPLQPNLVALQFAGNADAFQAILAQWQPAGVALFRSHLPVDAALLLAYGAFGYLLTTRTAVFARYTPAWRLRVSALMPVAALADVGENILHWYLTSGHLENAALLVPIATACSALKFAGIVLFGVVVVHARSVARR